MGELRRLVNDSEYSRFPVRDDGQLSSYVHAKELLRLEPLDAGVSLPDDSYRSMTELPAEANMTTALNAMTANNTHMAIVRSADRHLGVATFEDVLEQLLGELSPTESDRHSA